MDVRVRVIGCSHHYRRRREILLVDLETSPNQGFTWSKYETDVIEFTQPWVILSVAWQWYGQEKVHTKGLCDYPG